MRLGLGALVAGQSMVFGLAVNLSPPGGQARLIIHGVLAGAAVLVFLLVGLPVWREAAAAARRRRIVVEQFFLMGMFGAFAASVHSTLTGAGAVYYEVVAVLLAIYTLGSLVGAKRREAALASAETYQRQFAVATVRTCCGHEREVPVSEVSAGDTILVRPGAGVPVDGRIIEGTGFVREAAMTGEAFPVVKHPGDHVVSGSHSLDAMFVVEATAGGGARALDRLVAAVRAAQARPSGLQREADRLVGWFLPIVLAVAGLTFAGWTLHSGWVVALFNALAVLLVACPCAMGLATPIGVWSALGALASRGIICKSGEMVERLAQCDTVVFDKTGTLSDDQLVVQEVVLLPDIDRATLVAEIAALEAGSIHPVARAFREWARDSADARAGCRMDGQAVTLPGIGIQGVVAWPGGSRATLAVGNASLIEGQATTAANTLAASLLARASGDRLFYLLREGMPVGVAVLRECLRASSAEAVAALRSAGLRVLVMTGDTSEHARALDLGEVDGTLAGLTPEDKANEVRRLQARGSRVCFVGDGINDSLAMSEAHAAIALTGGADLAVASAGAEMRGASLSSLPISMDICRRVVKAIRGNLAFAACYNVLGMGLAAAGILHPVAAALIMLVSSVTVTWRALRHAERLQAASPEMEDHGIPSADDTPAGSPDSCLQPIHATGAAK